MRVAEGTNDASRRESLRAFRFARKRAGEGLLTGFADRSRWRRGSEKGLSLPCAHADTQLDLCVSCSNE